MSPPLFHKTALWGRKKEPSISNSYFHSFSFATSLHFHLPNGRRGKCFLPSITFGKNK
jgi:hypothetical protein